MNKTSIVPGAEWERHRRLPELAARAERLHPGHRSGQERPNHLGHPLVVREELEAHQLVRLRHRQQQEELSPSRHRLVPVVEFDCRLVLGYLWDS